MKRTRSGIAGRTLIERAMKRERSGPALHTDDDAWETDDHAWERLFDAYGESVFHYLHRRTRDADVADDLTQDVFVRVWERRGQFNPDGDIRSWIFSIATNLFRDSARIRTRREQLLSEESQGWETRSPDASGAVHARLTLREALERLPDDQRTALLLHEVDGYTHAEIGSMTGIAEGSSKARVSRARAALRELLEGRI